MFKTSTGCPLKMPFKLCMLISQSFLYKSWTFNATRKLANSNNGLEFVNLSHTGYKPPKFEQRFLLNTL